MGKRRYTDEERASAVTLLKANGYPNTEGALIKTSKAISIPESTLRSWFSGDRNPPPAQMCAEKTFDLREAIIDEIEQVFAQMKTRREKATYKDLATAFGILVDKVLALQNDGAHKLDVTITDARERVYSRLNDLIDSGTDYDLYQ